MYFIVLFVVIYFSYKHISKTCQLQFYRCECDTMSELYEAFVIILFTARVILYILHGRLVSILFYVYLITFIAITALVNTMHICILVNMNQYEYGLYRIWARLGQLAMIMEA